MHTHTLRAWFLLTGMQEACAYSSTLASAGTGPPDPGLRPPHAAQASFTEAEKQLGELVPPS